MKLYIYIILSLFLFFMQNSCRQEKKNDYIVLNEMLYSPKNLWYIYPNDYNGNYVMTFYWYRFYQNNSIKYGFYDIIYKDYFDYEYDDIIVSETWSYDESSKTLKIEDYKYHVLCVTKDTLLLQNAISKKTFCLVNIGMRNPENVCPKSIDSIVFINKHVF